MEEEEEEGRRSKEWEEGVRGGEIGRKGGKDRREKEGSGDKKKSWEGGIRGGERKDDDDDDEGEID